MILTSISNLYCSIIHSEYIIRYGIFNKIGRLYARMGIFYRFRSSLGNKLIYLTKRLWVPPQLTEMQRPAPRRSSQLIDAAHGRSQLTAHGGIRRGWAGPGRIRRCAKGEAEKYLTLLKDLTWPGPSRDK